MSNLFLYSILVCLVTNDDVESVLSTAPNECIFVKNTDFSECANMLAADECGGKKSKKNGAGKPLDGGKLPILPTDGGKFPGNGKSLGNGKSPGNGRSPGNGKSFGNGKSLGGGRPPGGRPPGEVRHTGKWNSSDGQTFDGGLQPLLSETCITQDICNKTFRLTSINLLPFSKGMTNQIQDMLKHCCGNCAGIVTVGALKYITELNETTLEKSDIVFPVFNRFSSEKLYGFWYIPIIDIPYAYYVRKGHTNKDAMNNMLKKFKKLWPLLLICIVFSIVAGFIIWILDTWFNQEEFPRSFLIGWFEGFWWSFISMTTVGYGDKAPKSRLARIFSIGWILIGITIFSLLTATLSNIITSAESPPSFDMAGKKIAALQNRIYDATVIAKHGGRVKVVKHDNLTDGIDKLIDMLFSPQTKNDTIDGFLLEKHTYLYYWKCSKRLSKTIRAVKQLHKDKYSYGMLVRNQYDYYYFRRYFEYNFFHFDTCIDFAINEMSKDITEPEGIALFSTDSGTFKPILVGMVVAIGVILVGGMIFELMQRNKMKIKTTDVPLS